MTRSLQFESTNPVMETASNSKPPKTEPRLTGVKPRVWRLSLATALFLVGLGWIFRPSAEPTLSPNSSEHASTSSSGTQVKHKPIEQIEPGEWVIADNPEFGPDESPPAVQVDPVTWKRVEMLLTKNDGTWLRIDSIQSPDWLALNDACVSSKVELAIAELGVEGVAIVEEVSNCPHVRPRPGPNTRLVTATFHHESAEVMYIGVAGSDPIGVTSNHPFWSADRHEFVAAGELNIGENLLTIDGKSDGRQSVYNLEVDGEHVYYVSNRGVLAHNVCRGEVIAALRAYLGRSEGAIANLRKLDPDARFGLTGSTATGRVGNPDKKATFGKPWNADDFDLDLFIVSDKLYGRYGDDLIGAPGVRDSLVREFPELFGGLRQGGKGVSIKIYPSRRPPGEAIFF